MLGVKIMSVIATEISIFSPNSRRIETDIRSLIPKQAINALTEKLGVDAGKKAEKALRQMKSIDSDLVQFRVDERRVRIKQTAK
jgi:hypothetical protein